MQGRLSSESLERLAEIENRLIPGNGQSALRFLTTLALGGADRPASDFEAVLDLIRSAFDAGFPQVAIAAAREAVTGAPQGGAPLFLLCSLLLRRADPEAGVLFAQCRARFSEPSAGWVELGDAFLATGQKAAALVCFGRGLPDAKLFLRCGLLARELGRRGEARAAFAQAVRFDRSSARAWFLLGTSAQDAGDHDAAATAYREVLRLDPAVAEAAVNLGIVLQGSGDLTAGKVSYAQAMQIRPDTFGRIAQALPGAPRGELWLDLAALRRSLAG